MRLDTKVVRYRLKPTACSWQLQIRRHKSYRGGSFNETFFDDGIISDEHASVWGLFLTDGCLHNSRVKSKCGTKMYEYPRLSWQAKYDSYLMLDKIRTIMDSTHTLNFDVNKQGSISCGTRWNAGNAWKCIESLMGCKMGEKTFHLKFPMHMDSQWYSSLIRTIVDGDGCWAIQRRKNSGSVKMCLRISSANKEFLESIKNVISLYCLNTQSGTMCKHNNSNTYELAYCSQMSCNKIGRWLYTSEIIGNDLLFEVPRKYSRFRLFQQLFVNENKPKPQDRRRIVDAFVTEESRKEAQILNELIAMSRGQIEFLPHYHFRRRFLELEPVSI
eukprot:813766_1